MINFKFGQNVCIGLDRQEHIKKHGIYLDLDSLVKIADRISEGKEGIHVFHDRCGLLQTMVIRGTHQKDEKSYSIFRTIWNGDAGSHPDGGRTGLPYFVSFFEIKSGSVRLQNTRSNSILSRILPLVRRVTNDANWKSVKRRNCATKPTS